MEKATVDRSLVPRWRLASVTGLWKDRCKAFTMFAALGSPGGFGIVQYVVQVIINMLDYGLDIQSAIEAPRIKIESLDGHVGKGEADPVLVPPSSRNFRLLRLTSF